MKKHKGRINENYVMYCFILIFCKVFTSLHNKNKFKNLEKYDNKNNCRYMTMTVKRPNEKWQFQSKGI